MITFRTLMRPMVRQARGTFYGWWMVAIAALVMTLGSVPFFQGMSAWFVVLEKQFLWSRGQLSVAFSLTRAEGSVMGPIAGYLIERLGVRRMVLVGLCVMGSGFLLFSQVHSLWQFYLSFVVISVGAGFGTWLPMMTLLNSWFVRRRSMAMALAMEGMSVSAIVLIPVLTWAIDPEEPDRIGWRYAAAVIGIIIIVLAFPISKLIRGRPEDFGLRPDGVAADPVRRVMEDRSETKSQEIEYTWQQAVRTGSFWLIAIGNATTAAVVVTMMINLGPWMSVDRDFSLQTVGWVVSTYTAMSAVSTLVGGYFGDRMPIRFVICGFSLVQTAGIVVALVADSLPIVYLFAVLLGIGFGGRTPLTSAIRGTYFGRRNYASITGVAQVPFNAVMFAVPLFVGFTFDATDSYTIPFIGLALVGFLGSLCFLLLGDPKPVGEPVTD